jgi:hypothetical protein
VAEVERARHSPWRTWLPAAAAASVALLAVVLWRMPGNGVEPAAQSGDPSPAAEVVEMLANGEGFDVVNEDPEFYTWLAAQELPANGAG